MTAAQLHLGPHIDVRVEHDVEAGRIHARFACRCGWVTRSTGRRLVIPDRVKAHARVCPFAYPDRQTFGGWAS